MLVDEIPLALPLEGVELGPSSFCGLLVYEEHFLAIQFSKGSAFIATGATRFDGQQLLALHAVFNLSVRR